MSLLPANATARRREEEIRVRERLALMERKLDEVILKGFSGTEAAKAPSTPALAEIEVSAEDVEFVGEILASYDSIPVGHVLSWTSRRDGPPIVTAVSLAGLGGLSIADCIRTGILTNGGTFRREAYQRALSERIGACREWIHPMSPDSKPAYAPRMILAD
jgi:hypothetical protein